MADAKKDDEQIEAKQRIFNAAVSLFARKGYNGVGMRELANKAGVQVSMINYYYDGKVGILKDIIDVCYDRYYNAILDTGDESMMIEDRITYLVRSIVDFFRNNTELAIVALSSIPVDIPEIMDQKIKWIESHRDATNKWYIALGLDLNNVPLMCVIRSFLTSIVFGFVESQYCCSHIAQTPTMPIHLQEHFKRGDHVTASDAAFYEQYVDNLAQVYLYGVTHMSKKKRNESK